MASHRALPEDSVDPALLKVYPDFVVHLQRISCDFTVLVQTKLPSAVGSLALLVHYAFLDEVIFVMTPCFGWIIDYDYGVTMMLSCAICDPLNGLIKWYFRYPRPCYIDSRIRNIRGAWEEDYGFPSGHTMAMQTIACVHLIYYLTKDQSQFTLIMIPVLFLLVLLTSFTRVYLGLHFIHDVAAGALIGPFVAWSAHSLHGWLKNQVLALRIETSLLLPMTIVLIGVILRTNLPSESLVQRTIWGNRAYKGYIKSKKPRKNTPASPTVDTHPSSRPMSSIQPNPPPVPAQRPPLSNQFEIITPVTTEIHLAEDNVLPSRPMSALSEVLPDRPMSINRELWSGRPLPMNREILPGTNPMASANNDLLLHRPMSATSDIWGARAMSIHSDYPRRFSDEDDNSFLLGASIRRGDKEEIEFTTRSPPNAAGTAGTSYHSLQPADQTLPQRGEAELGGQLHLYPRRFDRYAYTLTGCFALIFVPGILTHSRPTFNPCPEGFSKRRVLYWGFGFGGLVLMLAILMGLVGPALKKKFSERRWIMAVYRSCVMNSVIFWTFWLSWEAMFAIRPEWEQCSE